MAAEILLDVQRAAAAEMPASGLGFVNRWGLLGVGIPGAEDFPTDGVEHTLGRVAPDVAGGEDARAGGLYHAGLALRERPRLRPRGAGAGCRSIRFAR